MWTAEKKRKKKKPRERERERERERRERERERKQAGDKNISTIYLIHFTTVLQVLIVGLYINTVHRVKAGEKGP